MRRTSLFAVLAFLALTTARPAEAQTNQWRITPFAGGALFASSDGIELENTFTIGGSLMRRMGHIGIEFETRLTPSKVGTDIQKLDSEIGPGIIGLSFADDQNLWFNSLNLVLFTQKWEPGRPPPGPAPEFYALGGVGLMTFLDDHPASPEVWASGDSEVMYQLGAGLQFNLSSSLSLQLEARGGVFQVLERDSNQDKSEFNFAFKQGITFIKF